MSGYSIGLFKFMRIDENLQKKDVLVKNRRNILGEQKKKRNKKYLSYGEFERICFEEISQFHKFRDLSESTKGWIGDRQIHLIYSICEDDYPNDVCFRDGEFYEYDGKKAVLSNRLFIGLTILQFKNNQKEYSSDMETFLCECKKGILELVNQEQLDVKCAVFGTLGSFGLTIIWLSDQYTDVLKLVTKIKNAKSIFLSAYTIFAQNHKNGIDWEKRVSDIKGHAMLRITLKNGVNDEVLQNLNRWKESETSMYHCAGEHDVIIRMKSSELFMAFDKGKDLHFDSDFFKKYVLQSNVQFCEILQADEPLEEKPEEQAAENEKAGNEKKAANKYENEEGITERDSDQALLDLKPIQEEYKSLRIKFANVFPSTVGMVDTLDLLYGDYISKISTESNEMWVDDFSHQFLKVIKFLKEFIGKLQELQMEREEVLKIINELLGDFEWQISHIAQSNNLTLGTPICQFRYSGQNNLTLYAYFGIIKKVLNFVYQTQQDSMQDEIIPLIVADIVPIIQSAMYCDYEGDQESDSKIITINLPMVSLYNPVCYFPYLYHEIFHYVVPADRYERNRIFGYLMSIEVLYSFFTAALCQKMNYTSLDEELIDNFCFSILLKHVYTFCLDRYDELIGRMVEKLDGEDMTCKEVGQKVSKAFQFEEKILLKWIDWFNETEVTKLECNPVYRSIYHIYAQRDTIIKDINNWKNENSDHDRAELIADTAKEFMEELGGIADNRDLDAANENYQMFVSITGENVADNASTLISGIKESLADIAMVKLGAMDFSEYLLLFTKTKKDLLLDCSDDCMAEQDIIRAGMVLDFLYADRESGIVEAVDQAREKYINMYCGFYYSSHKEKEKDYFKMLYKDAEDWFLYWKKCSSLYLHRYGMYSVFLRELQKGLLVSEQHDDSLKRYMENSSEFWKKYAEILQAFGNFMRQDGMKCGSAKWEEQKASVKKRIFDLNIQLIYKYQYQDSFVLLDEVRTDRIRNIKAQKYNYKIIDFKKATLPSAQEHVVSTYKHYHWIYHIDNIGHFSTYTADIVQRLKETTSRILGGDNYPIWYRGQESAEYKLLPSIMRKYKEEKERQKEPNKFSISGFLKKKFEEFRFRSDGVEEAIERVGYTDGDYIALMQHYSVASNFLDWTEDVLQATYFALEGFLDKKVAKTNADAALYIFSPALYNHARIKMIFNQAETDCYQTDIEKEIKKLTTQEGIPNLSVSYNTEKYYMYLLGYDKFKEDNLTAFKSEEQKLEKRAFYLPTAVYTSRLNKRIRAQSGVFLAYNIYTRPEKDDTFDYVSLEEIQKDYLEQYQDDQDTCPFLYKIKIEKTRRGQIASWIDACGMSKEKCYPELVNIGERVMR